MYLTTQTVALLMKMFSRYDFLLLLFLLHLCLLWILYSEQYLYGSLFLVSEVSHIPSAVVLLQRNGFTSTFHDAKEREGNLEWMLKSCSTEAHWVSCVMVRTDADE